MDHWTLAVITAALGLGALVKGATGMGLPLIAVPTLATFLGVPHAVAIAVVPTTLSNLYQVWKYRHHRTGAAFVRPMIVGGLIGVALGTWLLTSVPAKVVSLTLGLLLVLYILLRVTQPRFLVSESLGLKLAPFVGVVAGALQGATGVSSPVLVTFVHAMRPTRDVLIFSISTLFLLFGAAQAVALVPTGLLNGTTLLQGLWAMVPVTVFLPIGAWLARRFSQRVFDIAILTLLAVIALQLVVRSLM